MFEKQWKLKVGLSPSKTNCFICVNESPLKMVRNVFLFHSKSSFRLYYKHGVNFKKKVKVNFKSFDDTDWGTKNHNAHITQYFKK